MADLSKLTLNYISFNNGLLWAKDIKVDSRFYFLELSKDEKTELVRIYTSLDGVSTLFVDYNNSYVLRKLFNESPFVNDKISDFILKIVADAKPDDEIFAILNESGGEIIFNSRDCQMSDRFNEIPNLDGNESQKFVLEINPKFNKLHYMRTDKESIVYALMKNFSRKLSHVAEKPQWYGTKAVFVLLAKKHGITLEKDCKGIISIDDVPMGKKNPDISEDGVNIWNKFLCGEKTDIDKSEVPLSLLNKKTIKLQGGKTYLLYCDIFLSGVEVESGVAFSYKGDTCIKLFISSDMSTKNYAKDKQILDDIRHGYQKILPGIHSIEIAFAIDDEVIVC